MTIKIICVFLLFSFSRALPQYDTVYIDTNSSPITYDKTRQEIMHNYLNNKPLLNYVPVYNTDYGHWNGENQKIIEDPSKKSQFVHTQTIQLSKPNPEIDIHKLGQVITRLRTDMQTLGQKTKHVYENKLKELQEVKKLHENLKVALHGTDALKNSLHQHEKQFIELAKNPQQNGYTTINPCGVNQIVKMIEGLDSTVQNFNYKYDGKLAM